MHVQVEVAKLAGFPGLPPGYGSAKQLSDFYKDWPLSDLSSLSEADVIELSAIVGEYENDSALTNAGVAFSLLGVMIVSAIAFSRASNNLYALGYNHSQIPPAWAFFLWFVPPLSFFLPWQVVSGLFSPVTENKEGEKVQRSSARSRVIPSIWGLAFLGLWILNPITLQWFGPTGDIDGWLAKLTWSDRMLIWLPITTFINLIVLLIVTISQHRRYRILDSMAGR
jgi:hypothetical protein